MAGPVGEKNGSYPFLTRFSTKTLRQLLREDFASREPSTPESDTFITCVAEVVARREAADPGIRKVSGPGTQPRRETTPAPLRRTWPGWPPSGLSSRAERSPTARPARKAPPPFKRKAPRL